MYPISWLETKYLYLILMLFTISYPLAQSFEWRIQYYKKWNRLIWAILITLIVFIPWDVWKTRQGVWWFNPEYYMGITIWSLPLEEWLFFIFVPFSCLFIYEVLLYFIKKDVLATIARPLSFGYAGILLIVGNIYFDRYYPCITFNLTAIVLLYFCFKNPHWLGRFWLAYLVSMIPFLLVNGALTGLFTERALVNYNPDEFMGIRIFTIPVEDSVFGFLMILIEVAVYESLAKPSIR